MLCTAIFPFTQMSYCTPNVISEYLCTLNHRKIYTIWRETKVLNLTMGLPSCSWSMAATYGIKLFRDPEKFWKAAVSSDTGWDQLASLHRREV